MPVILVLGELRQQDHSLVEPGLHRHCLKNKKQTENTRHEREAGLSNHGNCKGGLVSLDQTLAGQGLSCIRKGQG